MNDTSPAELEESGCAICGNLTLIKDLKKISKLDLNMEILKQKGVSQKERKSSYDKLADLDGPIIEDNLDNICNLCYQSVSKEKNYLKWLWLMANGWGKFQLNFKIYHMQNNY